jgi:enoyl-CoA hydratase/carnithine racemase
LFLTGILAVTESILEVQRDGDLLALTLNRPAFANALNPELTEALIDAISGAEDLRLCVIRGNGRHFCAGFDLADLDACSDGDLLARFLRIETLLQAVHHAPFAVAAFAQGQVVGAGADLFAACWQRIAAPDAQFRMPGWNFELALGTRRLARLIGADAARDLLVDTRVLSADESRACGLASEIAEVAEWAARMEGLHSRCQALSPFALAEMLTLTTRDSRDADLAAIVKTAGRPGLKQRISDYRARVIATKSKPASD